MTDSTNLGMTNIKFQGTVSGDGFGYVYVMSYPNSDKVKIGHSLSPQIRAVDIGGTLAPEQPTVEVLFWCSERREAVERAAHKLEDATRHNGEWFNISISKAITAIRMAAEQVQVEIQLVLDSGREVAIELGESALPGDLNSSSKRKVNPAFMSPLVPSAALASIVGKAPLARTEVISKLWAYIKKHKLQDQVDKRLINTDSNLRKIFGKNQVSMFEMAGLIGKHLT